MLKIEHLKKHYDNFSLDCSLEVRPGCVTGLIGQNGAGKSTSFKAVLGLISSDGGSMALHEDTDVLLSDYALLKVDEEQFAKLDKRFVLRSKKESYGYRCLTNQKQYYMENQRNRTKQLGKRKNRTNFKKEHLSFPASPSLLSVFLKKSL